MPNFSLFSSSFRGHFLSGQISSHVSFDLSTVFVNPNQCFGLVSWCGNAPKKAKLLTIYVTLRSVNAFLLALATLHLVPFWNLLLLFCFDSDFGLEFSAQILLYQMGKKYNGTFGQVNGKLGVRVVDNGIYAVAKVQFHFLVVFRGILSDNRHRIGRALKGNQQIKLHLYSARFYQNNIVCLKLSYFFD